MKRRALPLVLGLYVLGTLPFLSLPPLEDDKFWWVPKSLKVAEDGPGLVLSGPLPQGLLQGAVGALPPQWAGGLPDYGHPPVFFHYLGALFALGEPSAPLLHIGLLPLALLALIGTTKLTEALAPGWGPWGGALLGASPLFFAQGLRGDLDLPLVAIIPFALFALVQGHWMGFACLGALATWTKEPGVLLCVPALLAVIYGPNHHWKFRKLVNRKTTPLTYVNDIRLPLLCALSPFLALIAWAGIHFLAAGWALASPERLPDGGAGFLWDFGVAAKFLLLEQGRFLLLGLLPLPWLLEKKPPIRPDTPSSPSAKAGALVCLSFVFTILVFFSIVGFFGASAGRLGGATHLRYFLPALPPFIALGVMGARSLHQWASTKFTLLAPVALIASLAFALGDMVAPAPLGPERNLFGAHVALARQAIAPRIRSAAEAGKGVWIGQSEVPDFQFPGVWVLEEGIPDLEIYGPGTQPEALAPGDWVVVSAHGEPPGFLQSRLGEGKVVVTSTMGAAWVMIIEVGEPETMPQAQPSKRAEP